MLFWKNIIFFFPQEKFTNQANSFPLTKFEFYFFQKFSNVERGRKSTEFIREQLKEDLFSSDGGKPQKTSDEFLNSKNSQSVANLEDIITQLNALQSGESLLKEETLQMITKLKEDLKNSLIQVKGLKSGDVKVGGYIYKDLI